MRSTHLLLLAALCSGLATAPTVGESLCGTCHRQNARELSESKHADIELQCVDCHGGNANTEDQDLAHAAAAGFKRDRSKVEIVKLCADCHSDRQRMRPYGLPTDQYAEYETSQHGLALARGNTDVAICTDCHGKHKILPAKDPESTVHPGKLAETCGHCHADAALMKRHNLPADQHDKYVESVHGKAVLERGVQGAPTCASCHGNHGAAPPGATEVSSVCGQCHPNTREQFAKGPHKKAMDAKKMTECVSCHSNHGIHKTSRELLTEMCTDCHAQSSEAYGRGVELQRLVEETEAALAAQASALVEALHRGRSVESLEGKLEKAHTDLLQAAVVQHTLSVKEVDKSLAKVRAASAEVADVLEEIEGRLRARKIAVLYVWAFFLWIAFLLVLKRVRTAEAPVGDPADYEHAGE